ncbi:50S ribosomal protein L4 [bacterium]|nr:50S ribosomal protein L4 [bacterium]MBU1754209.1 50S ribosomal protein L4 [bacterium]
MPRVDLYNIEGEVIGEVELQPEIFEYKGSKAVVYEAVKAHLLNCRQGTVKAKTRGEVSGGGKKPFKQKGTGNARAGSNRSPVWRGGGVVFPPRPRQFEAKIPLKVRRAALYTVLTDKVKEGNLRVVDSLSIDSPKTSRMVQIFKKLKLSKPLVIMGNKDENVILSMRNIPGIGHLRFENLYAYEILKHPTLLITKDVIDGLNKVNEVETYV